LRDRPSGLHDGQRRRNDARDIGDVRRQDQRIGRTREIAELRDVFFGDAQVDRLQSAFGADRFGDLPDSLGRGFRFNERRGRFALRQIDLGLFLAFGFGIAASRAPCAMLICS
jgi:hypothetical protein